MGVGPVEVPVGVVPVAANADVAGGVQDVVDLQVRDHGGHTEAADVPVVLDRIVRSMLDKRANTCDCRTDTL